jgi:hypothetical protein
MTRRIGGHHGTGRSLRLTALGCHQPHYYLAPAHFAAQNSTTVTVTKLSDTEACRRGVQDGADAVPESVLTPALIPAVGGMPGAVACRHLAPRDASVQDPEQALEQTPVLHSGTATWRFLRRQERRDLLPEGVAESSGPCQHGGERRSSGSAQRLPRRAPGDMPLTGAGLVLPTPPDPVEPSGARHAAGPLPARSGAAPGAAPRGRSAHCRCGR